jgi:hypothetical protein
VEDVEDVVAAAELSSDVEDVMGVEMELVRLDVVTVVKAELAGEEDMTAVVSSVGSKRRTGRVGHGCR